MTAPGQPCRLRDALAAFTQGHDAGMGGGIGLAAGIPARSLRQLNALALAFAPVLVVVAGHLQGQFQKHVLHGLLVRSSVSMRKNAIDDDYQSTD